MLRLIVRIVLGLVLLVLVAVVAVIARGSWLIDAPVKRGALPITADVNDTALVARGRHLAQISCSACHAAAQSETLDGSREDFLVVPNGPTFGTLHAPNLTRGGHLGHVPDALVARAVREGIAHDGRPLLVMPSYRFHGLSDHDLTALVAWLRAQPAVDRPSLPRRVNLLGRVVLGLSMFPPSTMPAVTAPIPHPAEAATPDYGRYLVALGTCQDCHGEDLRGGRKGQFPPIGPDIVHVAHQEPLAGFDRALRQGIGHDGRALDASRMPWPTFAHMRDVEMEAVYRFLTSKPDSAIAPR